MMAKPITPTPRLDAKESARFLEDMERDRDRPMGPVETPKIKDVIKKILKKVIHETAQRIY